MLPPGVHTASLADVGERFAFNARRSWLFEGIVEVARALRVAGCRWMYLDGSYVTDKESPGDFDGYWDPRGVIPSLLDPVLLDFDNDRWAQKWKYRGEMLIGGEQLPNSDALVDLFQRDKHTGERKGIIRIKLEGAFS